MCSSGANVSKHSADHVRLRPSPLVHVRLVVLADGEPVDEHVALVGPRPPTQLQRVVAEGGGARRVEHWDFRGAAGRRLLLLLAGHHVGDRGRHLDSAWSGRRAGRRTVDENSGRAVCEKCGEAGSEQGLSAAGDHCPCRGDWLEENRGPAREQERFSCSCQGGVEIATWLNRVR